MGSFYLSIIIQGNVAFTLHPDSVSWAKIWVFDFSQLNRKKELRCKQYIVNLISPSPVNHSITARISNFHFLKVHVS